MEKEFVEAVEGAVEHIINDFQNQPDRFWNERDIHWCLFHYLKLDSAFLRDYGTELIRAELPTEAVYPEKNGTARGHYDLTILDPELATTRCLKQTRVQAASKGVLIAVEIKMWVSRANERNMRKSIDWDITKLTDPKNSVKHPYFLNFVQLDLTGRQVLEFFTQLRDYLAAKARPGLRILCLPHDKRKQPNPRVNWITHT